MKFFKILTVLSLFFLFGCGDSKNSSHQTTNKYPPYVDNTYRSATSNYAMDCESGHWISSVNRDGEVIILEDGSVWLVDPIDQIDSMLWLPTSDIVACYDKLINTDDGETVSARRVR